MVELLLTERESAEDAPIDRHVLAPPRRGCALRHETARTVARMPIVAPTAVPGAELHGQYLLAMWMLQRLGSERVNRHSCLDRHRPCRRDYHMRVPEVVPDRVLRQRRGGPIFPFLRILAAPAGDVVPHREVHHQPLVMLIRQPLGHLQTVLKKLAGRIVREHAVQPNITRARVVLVRREQQVDLLGRNQRLRRACEPDVHLKKQEVDTLVDQKLVRFELSVLHPRRQVLLPHARSRHDGVAEATGQLHSGHIERDEKVGVRETSRSVRHFHHIVNHVGGVRDVRDRKRHPLAPGRALGHRAELA